MNLQIMPQVLELDSEAWALRITARWRASVEAIIEVGQLLIDAKGRLPHGEFGKMLENSLPFGASTAQRLMAVASDNRLSNPAHVQLLPASWGTLYELTKLSDEEFDQGVENHIIRPDMERREIAERIRPHQVLESSAAVAQDAVNVLVAGSNPASPAIVIPEDSDRNAPAPMPSGGLAITHRRVEDTDSLDFFPTPPWATRALFDRVLTHLERKGHCQFQTAWEPACGEGHMAEVMREYFKRVYASDKADYGYGVGDHDFLKSVAPVTFDWIITNPPFNDSAEFVLKALKHAGTGVAMFVRLSWLESVGRYEKIFRDHPPTLVSIFTERVPLHKGRWEQDGATMTAYIWLVWIKGAEPRAPFWIPPGQREALTKSDDGARFAAKPEAT